MIRKYKTLAYIRALFTYQKTNFMKGQKICFTTPSIEDVKFTLTASPCDIPIKGNCSAIDEETDKRNEDYIMSELESGNEWAWCDVMITAEYKGVTGYDTLGGCSYKSQQDFETDGYCVDMKKQAFADLIENLKKLAD